MSETTNHNMPRVAVYGSLKLGQPNHYLLEDSKLLGRCFLPDDYAMLSLTAFPGVVQKGTNEALKDAKAPLCEVYSVTERVLADLDRLEGHPSFYCRTKLTTPFKNAWVYLLPHQYRDAHEPVLSGIWRPSEAEVRFVAEKAGEK